MDTLPQQLCLQVILILMNAFFASSEIAIISLNEIKLKKEAQEGSSNAKRLLRLIESPSSFLSTIQIGITLAGFLGSAFAADNFSDILVHFVYDDLGFRQLSLTTLDTLSVIVITLVLSYFTLVFGELVPKRIAMQKPDQVAKITGYVVEKLGYIVSPVVRFLSFSTNVVLKLLHLKTETEEESVTEEEIKMMMELARQEGNIEKVENEWIQNVFEFNDVSLYDIMTHRVDLQMIEVHASLKQVIDKIRNTGFSRFPVYEEKENHVIGILYARDYLLQASQKEEVDLRSILQPVQFVSENRLADDLFKEMQKDKRHIVMAVDEFGEISGLVTMEDLLETIVGQIYDEYDALEEPDILQIDETTWKVNGDILLEDLSKITQIPYDLDEDYGTLNGWIMARLETIPHDGSAFDMVIDDIHYDIKKIEHRRIKEVILKKIP